MRVCKSSSLERMEKEKKRAGAKVTRSRPLLMSVGMKGDSNLPVLLLVPTPPNHQLSLPLQAKTPPPHPNPSPSLPVFPLPLLKNRTPGSPLPAPPAPLENVTLNLGHSLATRPRLLNLSKRQAREERMKKRMRRLILMWRHPSPPNQWRSRARWVRLRVRHLLLRLRLRRRRQRNRRKMRRLQICFLPVVLKRSNNVILLLKHLRVIMLWRTLRLKRLGRLRRMLQRLKIPHSLDGDHGAARVQRSAKPTPSSSSRRPVSSLLPERTLPTPTLSSQRRRTEKRPNSSSRTCLTLTRARSSTRRALRYLWVMNGTAGAGSREVLCPGLLKR
nr:hypothetical protein I308_06293 [Cryptococcus tetragattii IND107]